MKNSEKTALALECIKNALEGIYVDEVVSHETVESAIEVAIAEAGLSGIAGVIKTCIFKVLKDAALVPEDFWAQSAEPVTPEVTV